LLENRSAAFPIDAVATVGNARMVAQGLRFSGGRHVDEGLILGRYRLLAELGEGGHGAVDLAFDTKMARRVAIKRIPISRRGIEILSRTTGLKEARTAALLNHPNIVTVYEWDTDDDEAFLIMEHVDGASLADVLDLYAPLDRDEAAAVISQVADAVAYAHENGVLHLDLKPENVLITREGLVKVADFGVAALTNAAGQAISAGGTLGYMAPEQLRGSRVDARTDIWAFAALAFEVLTGAMPFAADSVPEALLVAEGDRIPAPSAFVPSLPPCVDDLLGRAFAVDPADRPPELAPFAAELLAALGDQARGHAAVRGLVGQIVAEEPDTHESSSLAQLGVWDRLASRSATGSRAFVALAAAYLAWTGMQPLGFGWPGSLAATVVTGAAGFFAPAIGLAAALVVLAAGGFAVSLASGLALAAVGALWWISAGRTRPAAAAVPAFAPLAAVARLPFALPVLAGFFLQGTWPAAAAGAGTAAAIVATSALPGAARTPLSLSLGTPFNAGWYLRSSLLVIAFTGAAVISSLGAGRGTRFGAAAGALGGLALIAAAQVPWLTGGSQPPPAALMQLLFALILVGVVVALGPPVQAETVDTPDSQEEGT
jgi:eukaryotic-like serine/threonine-protein kinase